MGLCTLYGLLDGDELLLEEGRRMVVSNASEWNYPHYPAFYLLNNLEILQKMPTIMQKPLTKE